MLCDSQCSVALPLKVPWVGLLCVIVVFPDYAQLLFRSLAAKIANTYLIKYIYKVIFSVS